MRGEGNRGGAGIDASCVYNTCFQPPHRRHCGDCVRSEARRGAELRSPRSFVLFIPTPFHFVSFRVVSLSLSLRYEIGVLR